MMTPLELALDAVLVTMLAVLAVLAWCTLSARDLLQAAVLFITFGLTMLLPPLAMAAASLAAGLFAAMAGSPLDIAQHIATLMYRER